jgi:hypothetical protein
MKPLYKIPTRDKEGFPKDVSLDKPKHSKLRRWIQRRYYHYSEPLVWRKTITTFPKEFGVNDFSCETWNTKAMRGRISAIVEAQESSAMMSDYTAVIPGEACSHLHMRIGSYLAARRPFKLHNGLKGSKASSLSSFLILEECSKRKAGQRRKILETWNQLLTSDQWEFSSIGEHWRYGRFFVQRGKRFLRAEIWYDSRPWSPRERLARLSDFFSMRRRS